MNLIKKWFKKPKIAGRIIVLLSNLLKKSLQVKTYSHPAYHQSVPYLFAFWHGKQLMPVFFLEKHLTLKVALVSPSKDGDILAFWLNKLNYSVIRGSTRDGNIKCTIKLIKKIKQGYSAGFGIDGPIGPIYRVKPGMTYLSQKYNIPIVPLGNALLKKWIATKAWDKYQIPIPFSKATHYIGKPLYIGKDADLEVCNILLENSLHNAESHAIKLLGVI